MTAVLLAALFAIADRFSGGPWVARWGLPGRPIAYATAALLISAGLLIWRGLAEWDVVWAILVFAAWRWPSWDLEIEWRGRALGPFLPHACIDPRTRDQAVQTFIRHLPLAAPVLWGHPWAAATPFIALGLALWSGAKPADNAKRNAVAESLRGTAFGLLAAL